MDFIDSKGHIFSIETEEGCIGWNNVNSEYVMWIDSPVAGPSIPVGTWSIMQVIPYIGIGNTIGTNMSNIKLDNIVSVGITCQSNIFKVAGYRGTKNINDQLEFDMGSNVMQQYETSIIYNKSNLIKSSTEILSPFFVVCKSDEAGTFMTNCLIEVVYKDNNKTYSAYTVLTVGVVVSDISEKIEINANNFGISLDKEVLSAVYQSPIINKSEDFDASIYNEKLKELLMYRMQIKGEEGSYNGLRSALSWFGWSDKLEIFKLLKTDNNILEQYVRDSFDITDVSVNAFLRFRNTALVSFRLKENDLLYKEINGSGDEQIVVEPQDWNAEFNGEGIPETEDLFKKFVLSKLESEGSQLDYYEPYYMYDMSMTMLKLSFFKYYYKKYFCPVHVDILTASVEHRCPIQDIKLTQQFSTSICEKPILCQDECIVDIFNKDSYDLNDLSLCTARYETAQHYIDRNFLEFSIYKEKDYYDNIDDTSKSDTNINSSAQIYETHEMCIIIPLRFWSSMEEKLKYGDNSYIDSSYIYKTNIIVSKWVPDRTEYVTISEINTSFVQSNTNILENIIIIPRLNSIFKEEDIQWWTNGVFRIDICCNNRWFSQSFIIEKPQITADIGYLEYQYNQIFGPYRYFSDNSYKYHEDAYYTMWEPSLVDVTDVNYPIKIMNLGRENSELINKYIEQFNISDVETVPEYYNLTFYIDLIDTNGNIMNEDNGWTYDILKQYLMYYSFSEPAIYFIGYWLKTLDKYDLYKNGEGDTGSSAGMKIWMYVFIYYFTWFDGYLMKDEDYYKKTGKNKYYYVFILNKTISQLSDVLYKLLKYRPTTKQIIKSFEDFWRQYQGSNFFITKLLYKKNTDVRFLINRMKIKYPEGSNVTIPKNKILCCSLYKRETKQYCNDSYSITLDELSKYFDSFNIYVYLKPLIDMDESEWPDDLDEEIKEIIRLLKTDESEWPDDLDEEIEAAALYYKEIFDSIDENLPSLIGSSISGEGVFMLESFNLPFKMNVKSSKWRFIPYSLGIKNVKTVTSNANTALMSMQSSSSDYMSGYYNVEVDYSLDGKTVQTYKLPYKIRIER